MADNVAREAMVAEGMAIDAAVAATQLTTATVPVSLRPVVPAQAPLGGLPPLRLRLWVETASTGSEPPRAVSAVAEVTLRADGGEVRWPLYLADDAGLKSWQALRLCAQDAATGRAFDSIGLLLLRDLEE